MNDFLNIFVVSLEKDYKRREKLGIIPDYIYAVNGHELDIDEMKKDGIININNKMTKGEIGCYLSHIHMLKKALESKKQVLILEDDANIKVDTFQKIKALKDIPEDWDILSIGYNYFEEFSINSFNKIKYLHGAHAYLVNNKNITIEKINSLLPIDKPYDIALPIKLKTYIVKPKIIELGEFGGISNTQGIF
jgi:GR25 family glycosyltransferase involved in LPS biosynthesis